MGELTKEELSERLLGLSETVRDHGDDRDWRFYVECSLRELSDVLVGNSTEWYEKMVISVVVSKPKPTLTLVK